MGPCCTWTQLLPAGATCGQWGQASKGSAHGPRWVPVPHSPRTAVPTEGLLGAQPRSWPLVLFGGFWCLEAGHWSHAAQGPSQLPLITSLLLLMEITCFENPGHFGLHAARFLWLAETLLSAQLEGRAGQKSGSALSPWALQLHHRGCWPPVSSRTELLCLQAGASRVSENRAARHLLWVPEALGTAGHLLLSTPSVSGWVSS